MSLFPQELLEAIIDDLYDDLPTLRACGMVSRAFLHSTRTHIFANIRLTPKSGLPNPATVGSYPNCLNPCQKFHALLVNSPYISSYVQRLIIIDGSLFPSHPSADITGTAPSGSPWVLDEPSLPYVIRYLTRLRSVSLIFQEGPLRNWSAMSKALTDSLLSTLRLPNLESVELQRIGFDCPDQLFHLFNGAHALKNISLTSIRTSSAVFSAWEHAESKTIQQGGVLPQIEGLTVDTLDRSHFPLIQSIVTCHTALDLSSLRTIAIPNASISELRSIINLLQSVRGSLEHLTLPVSLCLPFGVKPYALDIDMSPYNGMKSIALGISVLYLGNDAAQSTVLWLSRLFSTFGHNNRLQNICISLQLQCASDLRSNEWRALDAVLCRSEMSSLRRVTFNVHPFKSQTPELDTSFRCMMPCTKARNLLHVVMKTPAQTHKKAGLGMRPRS